MFESGGAKALESWLQSLPGEARARTFIVDARGARDAQPAAAGLARPRPTRTSGAATIAPIGGALVLVGPGGSTYHVVIGPVRDSPRLFGELELPGVPLSILVIALGVSAAVCFFLARYLAAPVDRLRLATRRMAAR